MGLLASIRIEKGKPFAPDERMKAILTDAVAVGIPLVEEPAPEPASLRNLTPFDPERVYLLRQACKKTFDKTAPIKYI